MIKKLKIRVFNLLDADNILDVNILIIWLKLHKAYLYRSHPNAKVKIFKLA